MPAVSEQLVAAALDAMPGGIFVVCAAGKIHYRNTAASAFRQADTLSEAIPCQQVADWQETLRSLDGQGRQLTGLSIADKHGRTAAMDVFMRRLNQQGQAEPGRATADLPWESPDDAILVLVQASHATAEAVRSAESRIAHELGNPLDGVMRFIGLAQRAAAGDAARFLDQAKAGLTRVVRILRDMTHVPLDHGPARQAVDRLLEEAVHVMRPRAESLGVAIRVPKDSLPSVPVPVGMFQVFCNIIKNALDAMPHGGSLDVSASHSQADGRFSMSFADTGLGLTCEQAARIFEPRYTTKVGGHGMGLTISRDIVRAAGGDIVAAPCTGRGAIVTVTLPAPAAAGDGRGTKS